MTVAFSEIEDDFLRITTATVFCSATTVDPAAGRAGASCTPSSSRSTGGRAAGRRRR